MKIISLVILTLLGHYITAQSLQDQCKCGGEEYRQVNFWLGDWDVYDLNDVKVGENKVLQLQDNGVVPENWISEKGNTGTSYNFYNVLDSTWNQVWIDNTGYILKLKGSFENDKMVLKSERIKSENSSSYYHHKISWKKEVSGYINQKWE